MRKTVLLIAAAGIAAGAWLFSGGDDEVATRADVGWENRLWIDKLPSTPKEKINAMVAVDDPRIGVFQKTSAYEGDFTVFAWRGDGDKVTIEMLQTDSRHNLRMKVSDGDAGPFDYALRVKGAPRGPKKYYSMKDWVVSGTIAHDRRALTAWVQSRLAEASASASPASR